MKIKISFTAILVFLCAAQIVIAQKKTQPEQKKVLVCSHCGFPIKGKPIFLPQPEYPKSAKMVRASGAVQVQVTIDESGNVVAAKALSGNLLLHTAAIKSALKGKFEPILLNGKPAKVLGVIVYNFSLDEPVLPKQTEEPKQIERPKGKPVIDGISSKIVTGKAIKLPKPPIISCNCRFGIVKSISSVVVLADIDRQGNVIKAISVSGHPILKIASQKAAQKSKFNPTLISGISTKVRRAIVYKFEVINKWSAKVTKIEVEYIQGVNK